MVFAIALWCLVSGPVKQDDLTASQVVSKMLARYSGLQSLTGRITLVVKAEASTGKASREYDTDVQYERPSKVYINQVDKGHNLQWLVTSDGTYFTHNAAESQLPSQGHRMIELVITKDQETGAETINDVTKIYAACCTSINDRSVPLGIAFCWTDELRRFVSQWVNPTFVTPAAGSGDYQITGDHRPFATYPPSPVTGKFTMRISRNFDLLEYKTSELEGVPRHPGVTVSVASDWTVDLIPNGKPDESLFKAVR